MAAAPVFALLFLACASSAYPLSDSCNAEKLTVYRMVLRTYWTREKFPKHYPDWKPPAQWSKLYGLSHDPTFVLFRLGKRVTSEVQEFAESARSDSLGISTAGVMDTFGAPGILQGSGKTQADFFVDGNHSRVSLMSRMIPSPDWFIGIDSFDLCVDGNWLDSITVELDPLDAGTDNGFTFTASNWPTSPQGVAYRITSRYPSHPAGSFFYPHMRRLPPIATVQFIKLREYEVSEVFHRAPDSSRYDVLELEKQSENNIDLRSGNRAIDMEIEEEQREESLVIHTNDGIYQDSGKLSYTLYNTSDMTTATPKLLNTHLSDFSDSAQESLRGLARRYKARRRRKNKNETMLSSSVKPDVKRKKKKSRLADCRVSSWSDWSDCGQGCGVGESHRLRRVIRKGRPGGRPCPPLTQTRWCATNFLNCTDEVKRYQW